MTALPPPARLAWMVWALGAALYLIAFYQRVAPAVITQELSRDFGLSAGASVFIMTGAWKPLVSVSLPIYFLDSGALVGAHAALGVQWDPTASLGFFLHAGVQYYFGAPEGISDVAFVPSLGAQLRL